MGSWTLRTIVWKKKSYRDALSLLSLSLCPVWSLDHLLCWQTSLQAFTGTTAEGNPMLLLSSLSMATVRVTAQERFIYFQYPLCFHYLSHWDWWWRRKHSLRPTLDCTLPGNCQAFVCFVKRNLQFFTGNTHKRRSAYPRNYFLLPSGQEWTHNACLAPVAELVY